MGRNDFLEFLEIHVVMATMEIENLSSSPSNLLVVFRCFAKGWLILVRFFSHGLNVQ